MLFFINSTLSDLNTISNATYNPTTTIPSITKVFPTDTIIEHKVVEVKKWYKDKSNEEKSIENILLIVSIIV